MGVGLLLLAFVAYQLWGTALYEHNAQARLQHELTPSLRTTGTLPKGPRGAGSGSTDPLTSRAAPPTADPAVGNPVGLLSIPAIGMSKVVIVEGTDDGQLQEGPGHYPGTPLPGEVGNASIAGHRTTYGAPFYSLDALHPGDAINIETPQGLFQYLVVLTKIVQPTDTSVLEASVLPELTLTTCNPRYSASQRLVVQALLHTSLTNASFVPTPKTTTGSLPASLPGDSGTTSGARSAGSGVFGNVLGAVLWGLGAVVAAVVSRVAFRRIRGAPRWASLAGAGLAVFLLLGCFEHVSLALPASF